MKRWSLVVLILAIAAMPLSAAEKGDNLIRFGAAFIAPSGDGSIPFTDPLLEIENVLVEIEEDVTLPPPMEVPFTASGDVIGTYGTLEADTAVGVFATYEYLVTDLLGIEGGILWGSHDVDFDFTTATVPIAVSGSVNTTTFEISDLDFDLDDLDAGDVLDVLESIETGSETIGDLDMIPLVIGLNFHLLDNDKVDFYAGPFASYVTYSDLKIDGGSDLDVDSDFGFGAVVGIDVGIGEGKWMFSAAVRYLQTTAEIDIPGERVDVDVEGTATFNPPIGPPLTQTVTATVPFDLPGRMLEVDVDPWIVQVGVGVKF